MRQKLVLIMTAITLFAVMAPSSSRAQGCRSAPIGSRYGVYYVGGGCGAATTPPLVGWVWFRFTENGVPLPPFAVPAYTLNNGTTLYQAFYAAAMMPGNKPGGLNFEEWGCNGCELTSLGPPNPLMNKREFILYADIRDDRFYRLWWAPNVPAGPALGAPGAFAVITANTPPAPWPGGALLHAAGPDCQPCNGGMFAKTGSLLTEPNAPSAFMAQIDTGSVPFAPGTVVPAVSGWWIVALALALVLGGAGFLKGRIFSGPEAT